MLNRQLMLSGLAALLAAFLLPFCAAQEGGERDPGVADQIQRAQNLYETGQSQEALSVVEDVLERAAGDAEARFLQGLIFADMGRSDEAIEVFAALTADFPELPEPWNNLAVLFAENGEFDKARQALLAAIQTHPSYSTAHENLGDLYARMAGMAYDRALEQDRGNESARLKLSAVNGLFSVPAAPVTQVASTRPAPVSEPAVSTAPVSEPPPSEPAVTEPVVTPPATTVASVPEPTPPPPEPVQVAVAEPEPEPAAPDLSAIERDVARAVRGWAAAWSNQDVDGYLGSYASTFRPSNGASRASWVRYRRERLSAPSFIEVKVNDLDVTVRDENSAEATFVQGYRSDNYEDQVRKTLSMVLSDGSWRIATEASDSG